MSEMLAVSRQDLPAGSTNVIQSNGTAKFSRNKTCTWYTAGGSMSSVTISNVGKYTLSAIISGAPETVQDTNGKVLNGVWTIPKGQRIIALADFLGRTVSIVNNSVESTDCEVLAQTRT